MTEIPEDVMQTAREVVSNELFLLAAAHGTAVTNDHTVEAIARAIMAERERFMNEFEGAAEIGIDANVEAERQRWQRQIEPCGKCGRNRLK